MLRRGESVRKAQSFSLQTVVTAVIVVIVIIVVIFLLINTIRGNWNPAINKSQQAVRDQNCESFLNQDRKCMAACPPDKWKVVSTSAQDCDGYLCCEKLPDEEE